jgi:GTP1/Obg family GTP-binding protein
MEKWYLSHFRTNHQQKVAQKREINFDSLPALLQQFPSISNTASFNDIQYINISFDDQIKSMMEDIEKMTHVLQKTHTTNCLS